ncbi:hypothetical protein SADUNF_SadunfUnG0002300 [Salix dunnii]|uniref:Uncharacterized protein n=1 Tax=Salix dunnii TaxID=1413687 RepID=A0A835J0R6_9ROSI|nr:hypothetical protein SADUNF_SadunfUnG0002300 [Salix dunnii]
MDPNAQEQRYVDAVNGMVRTTASFRLSPINANHPYLSLSNSSPAEITSPESNTVDSVTHERMAIMLVETQCLESIALQVYAM